MTYSYSFAPLAGFSAMMGLFFGALIATATCTVLYVHRQEGAEASHQRLARALETEQIAHNQDRVGRLQAEDALREAQRQVRAYEAENARLRLPMTPDERCAQQVARAVSHRLPVAPGDAPMEQVTANDMERVARASCGYWLIRNEQDGDAMARHWAQYCRGAGIYLMPDLFATEAP